MRPELVIFDVDGLLLNTEAKWQEAWHVVGLKHGIKDFGEKTFLKCVGSTGKVVEDIVINELGSKELALSILDEARVYGQQLLDKGIDVKPGVYELLEMLEGLSIKRAVATTTSKELTYKRLSNLNLIQYFDYILCGDEVTKRKPDPEIYNKVMQHFDVKLENALVLEDSVVGVEAAYRAHIPCIMVPDLILASDKQRKEAVAIVSSLHDVIKLFE